MSLSDLDYDAYEIGEYAHYSSGNEHEDEYAGDALFKVCVLPEEMPRIEQEADKEDDAQDDGEYGTDGIGHIVNGILDAPDLGKKGRGQQ